MVFDALNNSELELLKTITDGLELKDGEAFNIRLNGKGVMRQINDYVKIAPKTDKPGIDIYVKDGTVGEQLHIPVIISESGLKETVFNDFHIGKNCDVVILAGCGIHSCGGESDQEHSGIHSFYVGSGSKVKYIEKHFGSGETKAKRIMNPTTYVEMEADSYLEMETTQIGGVDYTSRISSAILGENAKLIIKEKIMTDGEQFAKTNFTVDLNGDGSSAKLMSRSVAKDNSKQEFVSNIRGNARCTAHSECDAIVMDNAKVSASPIVAANNIDASLVHEAAIGKIAGEQIIKLMTLGLTEREAEEEIVKGFLK